MHIPLRYPILELCMGLVFVFMGYVALSVFQIEIATIAFFWLIALGFLTVVYIFYDIFFMEIPDQIFVIWLV